jgi:hypothetical protein
MKRIFIAAWLALSVTGAGECWTSRTYQLITVKSLRLMPASFQRIMLRHKEEILSGCLRPDEAPESGHTYDLKAQSGSLQDRILELSESIPRRIRAQAPFRELAADFGRLAHYAADLNDLLIIGAADPREDQYRQDFAIYLEKNIELFPWIFDGHEHPLLMAGKEREYIHEVASAAVERYDRLGEAYFPAGVLVSSDTFDPKSLPFGIANLSYNRSISRTVQLWFHIWKKSHGDTTLTPLLKSKGDHP